MLIMDNGQFEGKTFALQIVSKGAFVDTYTSPGKAFMVEAATIRLNRPAMGEWVDSNMHNTRATYEDGPAGDANWEIHQAKYAIRRKAVQDKIKTAVGIDLDAEGVFIEQISHTEVFTVLHIWEIPPEKQGAETENL